QYRRTTRKYTDRIIPCISGCADLRPYNAPLHQYLSGDIAFFPLLLMSPIFPGPETGNGSHE
ncbi:hypothetical protein, partial [Escherichia coli]|uniref:hypothetical protein n=1 Tax=Escherichia coli TaxID=562 RepID=UPI00193BF2C8